VLEKLIGLFAHFTRVQALAPGIDVTIGLQQHQESSIPANDRVVNILTVVAPSNDNTQVCCEDTNRLKASDQET